MVGRWFKKYQSQTTTVVISGAPMGALVFNPLMEVIMENYELRSVMKVYGICLLIITFVCSFGYLPFSQTFICEEKVPNEGLENRKTSSCQEVECQFGQEQKNAKTVGEFKGENNIGFTEDSKIGELNQDSKDPSKVQNNDEDDFEIHFNKIHAIQKRDSHNNTTRQDFITRDDDKNESENQVERKHDEENANVRNTTLPSKADSDTHIQNKTEEENDDDTGFRFRMELVKNKAYLLFIFCRFFGILAYYVPLFHLVRFTFLLFGSTSTFR